MAQLGNIESMKADYKERLATLTTQLPAIYTAADVASAQAAIDATTTIAELEALDLNLVKYITLENKANAGKYVSITSTAATFTTEKANAIIKLHTNPDGTFYMQGFTSKYYLDDIYVSSSAAPVATPTVKFVGRTDSEGYVAIRPFKYSDTGWSDGYHFIHYSGGNVVGWTTSGADASFYTIEESPIPAAVTINVKDEAGNVILTENVNYYVGEVISEAPSSVQNDYVTLESAALPYTVTEAEGQAIEFTATYTGLPFTLSEDYDNATWYYLHGHASYTDRFISTNADETVYQVGKTYDDAHAWAFMGNPYALKVINKAAGATKTLNATNPATMAETQATWTLRKQTNTSYQGNAGDNGFGLYTNTYLNTQGSTLKYWGAFDQGSTFWVIEFLPEITYQIQDNGEVIYERVEAVQPNTSIRTLPASLNVPNVTFEDNGWKQLLRNINTDITVPLTFTYGLDIATFSKTEGRVFAQTRDDAKWYNLKNTNSGTIYLSQKADGTVYANSALTDVRENWAFVGDPWNGFYIYNQNDCFEATDKVLASQHNYYDNTAIKMVNKNADATYANQVWQVNASSGHPERFVIRPFNNQTNALRLDGVGVYIEDGSGDGWGNVVAYPSLAAIQEVTEDDIVTLYLTHFTVTDKDGNLLFDRDVATEYKEITEVPTGKDFVNVNFAKYPAITPVTAVRAGETVPVVEVTAEWDNDIINVAEDIKEAVWYRIKGGDSENSFGYNLETNTIIEKGSFDPTNVGFYWAFVSSNPFQGVTVYNMAAYIEDQTKVLGSNGAGNTDSWKIVATDDEEYSNQVFSITWGGYTDGRFNLTDYLKKSFEIKGWSTVSNTNYSWGQFSRRVVRAADEYQDPLSLNIDYTTPFNEDVAPWLEKAGEPFYVKAELIAGYDLEALKANCDEASYTALKAIVDDYNSYAYPDGFFRLWAGHQWNAAGAYLTLNADGNLTYVYAPSMQKADLTTVFKLTPTTGRKFTMEAQGRYKNRGANTFGTSVTELTWVLAAPGKAAIYVPSGEPKDFSADGNYYLNSTCTLWKGDRAAQRDDTFWSVLEVPENDLALTLNVAGTAAYATLAVPYPTAFSGSTKAYVVQLTVEGEKTYADLAEFEGGIVPAGEPALIINSDAETTINFSVAKADGTAVENDLTGTFLKKAWEADDLALGQSAGVVGFYKWNGTELKANHAYISATDIPVAGVREVIIRNGETTGISEIAAKQFEGQAYDLQGRRVNAAQNGVFIVNGKKVLVK